MRLQKKKKKVRNSFQVLPNLSTFFLSLIYELVNIATQSQEGLQMFHKLIFQGVVSGR